MATQTITSRGSISPSQDFLDEVVKTVRQMQGKVEILWDGASWTDETTYLISAKANEEMGDESGEGVSATLDVELDNTTNRFTPEDTSSPIYAYLKPRVKIKVSVIMGGYEYKLFTGYIKNIHPNIKTGICSLECYDNQVVVSNKETNGVVYENYRSDQLLAVLAELAGMTSDEWDFDAGMHIINYGYFERRNVWPLMGEIASAERGRVFFDRDGKLKFWNRDRLHNKPAVLTLDRTDWIKQLDYSVSEHQIKNSVTVQAIPRAAAGIQVVWTSGDVTFLDPYSDTLVYVPAGSSQVAFLELEDPCTTFITPVANTDYIANSAQDGSGDDLTADISIVNFVNYGNAVYITVSNNGATDAYLTKFQLRGNPVRILKYIRVKATDSPSIATYGEQTIEIQNNFIQDEDAALQIAYEELWRRQDAINNFDLEIIGIPYLVCGDVVSVEYVDGLYKNYMVQTLDWTLDDGGFTQKLRMVNPYLFPSIVRLDARANILASGTATVEAKANIV